MPYNITNLPNPSNSAVTAPVTPNYVFTNNGSVTGSSHIFSQYEKDMEEVKVALSKINERLLILTPDPAKLEKYAALKASYDHYKMLEAIIND